MATKSKAKNLPKTKNATPARDTRRRIVLCAISMFNRHGIPNIAVDTIAYELKISPGNLTYHFRKKNDLIRATLEELKDRLTFALQRPLDVQSANDGAEYMMRLFRSLWEFRFFFNSLAYLLTDDDKLRQEYSLFYEWHIDTTTADIEDLGRLGHVVMPTAPNDVRLLTECVWGLILHWLRLQQIETPSAVTPSNEALYNLGLHIWSMWQPWMKTSYAAGFLLSFQNLHRPGADPEVPLKRSAPPRKKTRARKAAAR